MSIWGIERGDRKSGLSRSHRDTEMHEHEIGTAIVNLGIAVSGQGARGSQEAPANPLLAVKRGDLLNFGEAFING